MAEGCEESSPSSIEAFTVLRKTEPVSDVQGFHLTAKISDHG